MTTAATIWFVTVLGLLFGGGNLYLGIAGSLVAFLILWALKLVEKRLSRVHHGSLHLSFSVGAPDEEVLRQQLLANNFVIVHWSPLYEPALSLAAVDCEVKWTASSSRIPQIPHAVEQLRALPGVVSLQWKE